MIVLARLGEI